MTYAAVADIQNEFRKITFDGSSDFTDVRIQGFLDEADAQINLCLSNKYVIPITGVQSLLVLKRIEIAIVSARVAAIIDLKQYQNQDKVIKQEFNKRDYATESMKLLKDLQEEKITLIDADLINSDYGMSSTLIDDCIQPIFKKYKDQW